MYSMVLMAALTTGTDMPDWGRRGGCCGCWGGGWGGCYGCYGGYGWGGCYGGYGWGGRGWGGGGWGGGWGGGGWGGGGWGGWGYVYAPTVPTYVAPAALVTNTPAITSPLNRSMYYSPQMSSGRRATLTVHLPENARLIVDGKPTASASGTRRFYSPPLEAGKSYHYTLEARIERDGKTVRAERRVEVQAGDQREVTIVMPDVDQTPDTQQTAKPD